MYVLSDSTVNVVGDGKPSAGKMSPRNMKVTSITDQLRIATQFRSKVIGIAFKDRGAILPAGRFGLAYWYDAGTGNWITSDYYQKQLPEWVNTFNNLKLPQQYITKIWEPLQPLSNYIETEDDDQPYEATMSGEAKTVFPHKVTMGSLAQSYFGNELTKNFAITAIDAEKMGMGKADFLTLVFLLLTILDMPFGAQSKEVQDVYLRLDKNIEELLLHLDKKLGVGNYTVFLSADHGVAEIPAFMRKHNIPAGLFLGGELEKKLNLYWPKFGEGKFILEESNYQLYMNRTLLAQKYYFRSSNCFTEK